MTSENSSNSFDLDEIQSDLADLRERLDSKAPLSDLLVKIHQNLFKKPETLSVLSDSDIAVLIKGIESHSQVSLVVGKARPAIKNKFSMNDIDLDL